MKSVGAAWRESDAEAIRNQTAERRLNRHNIQK
jgi:hypothetical protein